MEEYGLLMIQEDLKKYLTLGVGPTVHYLLKPSNTENLSKALNYLKFNNIPYIILGNGSNIIMNDKPFDGAVIKLDKFTDIKFKDDYVYVEAGYMLPRLANDLLQRGYTNLYWATMIPGTIGGGVVGNCGCYNHDIMESIISVTVIDENNEIREIPKEEISYTYRNTNLRKYIVIGAKIALIEGDVEAAKNEIQTNTAKRKNTQPLEYKNVGSIFKNPEGASAGKLIEEAGLKGYTIGGAQISQKHANFIINKDNATFNDVISLIDLIQTTIKEKYDIDLEVEPRIIQ